MRKAFNNISILTNKQGEFVGYNLGSDFCAEHEWGIKKLQIEFGIDTSKIGIEKRKICSLPKVYSELSPRLEFIKTNKISGIVFASKYIIDEISKNEYQETKIKSESEIVSAWDSKYFAIVSNIQEHQKNLKILYDQFKLLNVAIMLGGGSSNPFSNAGLCLIIVNRIDKDALQELKNQDILHQKLLKESKKTKIEKILEKAGKDYFALSPTWVKNNEKHETKYKVMYWLNPKHQDDNNCGYFTVEELKAWTKEKGPVPKT